MKITNFRPDGMPVALGGWSSGVISLNSNVEITGGGPAALNFVQRITAAGSNTLLNPIVNFAAGTGMAISATSNTITYSATGTASGGGSGTLTTVEEVDGSPTDSAVTKLVFPNGTLAIASHVATYTPTGGGSVTDYVSGASGTGQIIIPGLAGSADIRVAATNDDEFDTTDTSDPMTGWTTLGTPSTHDINSTVKSHYYVQSTTASVALVGIYKACPAIPFTVTCKVSDYLFTGTTSMRAGVAIMEAAPGKIASVNVNQAGSINATNWTNRTTFSSNVGAFTMYGPLYFRIVVTSSTNVAYQASPNGKIWSDIIAGQNPGFTVGAAGLIINHGGVTTSAIFDWIRFT